jgi:hypothetical protein
MASFCFSRKHSQKFTQFLIGSNQGVRRSFSDKMDTFFQFVLSYYKKKVETLFRTIRQHSKNLLNAVTLITK